MKNKWNKEKEKKRESERMKKDKKERVGRETKRAQRVHSETGMRTQGWKEVKNAERNKKKLEMGGGGRSEFRSVRIGLNLVRTNIKRWAVTRFKSTFKEMA
jgi:hypothetical protein